MFPSLATTRGKSEHMIRAGLVFCDVTLSKYSPKFFGDVAK
jgi:hypothetical protein